MSRILITGSRGFLGKHLTAELRKRGHEVWGCDLTHDADPQYVRADVAEWRQVSPLAFYPAKPDVVYHLAAEFGRVNGHRYPEQLWRTNQIGTENVIRACYEYGSKLILASSSEVYGDWTGMLGNWDGLLKESLLDQYPPSHQNQYALSKWVQERQIRIGMQYGLQTKILRFFNIYGEGEYYSDYRSVVCLFCYRLLKGLPITVYRNGYRAFMHVDDWTPAVANICERFGSLEHDTYNIGGIDYRSVEDLARIVSQSAIGKTADPSGMYQNINWMDSEPHNSAAKRPDIARASKELGLNPKINLEQGIPRVISWMRKEYGL